MQPEGKPDLSKLKIDRAVRDTGPGDRRSLPFLAIGAVLLLGTAYFLWPERSGQSADLPVSRAETGSDTQRSPGEKVTAAPPPPQASTSLIASGYVVAQRQAAVSSKATGRLKSLNVVEGDKVTAGQLIGILENDDLLAEVKEREANLEAQKARLESARSELKEATRQRSLLTKLLKDSVISKDEYERVDSAFRKAEAETAAAEAGLALASAQVEKSKISLSYTHIYSPFDGTVLSKDAELGEVVAPFGSSANARAAIVTIADMNSMEVEADVSEANLSKVFVGQECEIRLDSFPDKKYRGTVNKIVPTVDRAKATVLTKIKFLDIDSSVIPEMSAKVTFMLRKKTEGNGEPPPAN